jgi:DNA-binding transcriptional regulator YhcF (GntR family)
MPRATKLRDKPHARIYHYWLELPAWQTLSAQGKALLIIMSAIYRPTMPVISMTDRTAAALIPCSRATAAKVLAELEDKGWIRVERVGARCKAGEKRRGSAFRLTTQPFIDEPASNDYRRWRNADGL